ncbi:MAG: DegT/DnrJ/EryC1/StrS family aminotransferase [Baekduiaceae bacterium]
MATAHTGPVVPPSNDRAPRQLEDLAVLGGRPAFVQPRHVGRPNIGDRAQLHARIEGALERGWLANDGPLIAEFEDRVCDLVAAEHCVAVSSATVGLQLVARALDLTGEIVMPSFTFIGTAHAFTWLGLTPVFVDIDPATHNVDPAAVEAAITTSTSAIVGVHVWGRWCDVDALEAIADRHGVPLILDAAHALATTDRGRLVGAGGRAEVFSFHATKVAGAGEGGAITTDDGELAHRLRRMKNFGFAGYDRVVSGGTNAKMPEFSAALGLTSLDALDEFVALNLRNYDRYAHGLAGLPGVRLVEFEPGERHNWQYVVAEIDEPGLRDALVTVLHGERVLARRYFAPGCHLMEPYGREGAVRLPATEAVADRVLVLPTGTSISEDDIDTICAIIRLAVEHHEHLLDRLAP